MELSINNKFKIYTYTDTCKNL